MITLFLTQKHYHNPEELLVKMEKIYESLQTEEERNSFNRNIVYLLLAFKKGAHIVDIIKKDQHKPIHQAFMTLYEQAISEGIQKGKLEGKLEGKTEVILKGYDNGVSLAILTNITDLTVAEVTRILKKNKRIL
jgi:predicted transposase/invertase (TIGR01784 family)